MKFYSYKKINALDCDYNMIIGERSNGKTYNLLYNALKDYIDGKGKMVYIRRWSEDIVARRLGKLWTGIIENNVVFDLTKGEFTTIAVKNKTFYLANKDEEGKYIYSDTDIIGYAVSISEVEHDKSTESGDVKNIIFDEFLAKRVYLPDEFVLFCNTLSTIIRNRNNVKIWMLGNTVNKYSPYFDEMGLDNIKNQKQGTIDVYTYGNSDLKVAVEYCSSVNQSKKSNKYFAFNNPKLQMITGGKWELDIFPHNHIKYKMDDIALSAFFIFAGDIYQGDIVFYESKNIFMHIHPKTTEIKNDDDLIFQVDFDPRLNVCSNASSPPTELHGKILWFFNHDKVTYANNEVGNAINNLLMEMRRR